MPRRRPLRSTKAIAKQVGGLAGADLVAAVAVDLVVLEVLVDVAHWEGLTGQEPWTTRELSLVVVVDLRVTFMR